MPKRSLERKLETIRNNTIKLLQLMVGDPKLKPFH